MRVKDITLTAPEENILYDEALFQLAEEGKAGEVLRFWESPQHFVVLGRIGKTEEDLCLESVKADQISVLRRVSGGGTVLQGEGCLNFTLVLSKENKEIAELKRSYRYILGKIVEALAPLGIEAAYFPISDIAVKSDEKKFSGNAQKRGRHFILHHGTLLLDFDLSLISKYLSVPKEVPDYRRGRSHDAFLCNLQLPAQAVKEAIQTVFDANEHDDALNKVERDKLAQLLESRTVFVHL